MNPFGIFQAVAALVEGALSQIIRKRQKETSRERRMFLILYFGALLIGIVLIIWVARSLRSTGALSARVIRKGLQLNIQHCPALCIGAFVLLIVFAIARGTLCSDE